MKKQKKEENKSLDKKSSDAILEEVKRKSVLDWGIIELAESVRDRKTR